MRFVKGRGHWRVRTIQKRETPEVLKPRAPRDEITRTTLFQASDSVPRCYLWVLTLINRSGCASTPVAALSGFPLTLGSQ